MNIKVCKDKDRSGNNRFFVERGEYFMTMCHGNIFSIYKYNKPENSIVNINKHIATYYSIVDAFTEFERLTKEVSSDS